MYSCNIAGSSLPWEVTANKLNKATVPGNWFWRLAHLGLLHLKDQSFKFCSETQFCWSVNVKMIPFYVVNSGIHWVYERWLKNGHFFFFCPGVSLVLANVKSCAGYVDYFRRAVQAILERKERFDTTCVLEN